MNEKILNPLEPSPRRDRVAAGTWRELVESLPDAVLVVDAEGRTLYANGAARKLCVGGPTDLPALPPLDTGIRGAQELVLPGEDGAPRHLEARCAPLRWSSSEAWSVVLRNVTRRKAFEARMRHAARHDELTGLPNRGAFMRRLQAAVRRAKRRASARFGVIFVDLDRFKAINDRHGHSTGDLVLDEVGARLRRCLRDGDMVARIGGDEFVVLLENLVDDAIAQRVAERIRFELDAPLLVADLELHVEASVGVALSSRSKGAPAEVLEAADRAMYQSKRMGGVVFSE